MNEIVLTGRVDLALSHFALVGLATIVEAESASPTRLWWRDGAEPQPVMATPLSHDEVGEVVRGHAERSAAPGSWMRARFPLPGKGESRSLFASRAKAPASGADPEGWQLYAARRETTLTELDRLAISMIEGLGEPAWWRVSERESRPDDGASRWEMKTRNSGEEMVSDRLLPLAGVCAARSAGDVVEGLVGGSLVDEEGSGGESRTASGLMPPGPADSAVAWCALWALSRIPPTAVLPSVSSTPGTAPLGRTHPKTATLPLAATPTTPQRWGQLMRSGAFAVLADSRAEPTAEAAARAWLREQGAAGLLRCEVHKGGSASAPERWVQPGVLEIWS